MCSVSILHITLTIVLKVRLAWMMQNREAGLAHIMTVNIWSLQSRQCLVRIGL
jgi:hypothetical protein